MKKIPEYIITAIKRRANAARIYCDADNLISRWCDKNHIDTEFTDLHVETITNYNVNMYVQDIYDNMNK